MSLIFGRVIYAVNWYNIAALYSLIALDFSANVSGLAAITAAFFVGIALFQIPGGILARKIGPKNTVILGTLISSSAITLSGLLSNFSGIIFLRFVTGFGMALIFAPGVALISRSFKEGSEAFAIGMYNAAFNVGGAIGLFAWPVLGVLIGWRISIVASGVMGLLSGLSMVYLIPPYTQASGTLSIVQQLRKIIFDRTVALVSLYLLGMDVCSTITSSFMVFFLEDKLGADPGIAGTLGSLTFISSLASAPFSGRVFTGLSGASKLLLITGMLAIAGVSVTAIGNFESAVLSTVIVGAATQTAFTIGVSAIQMSGAQSQGHGIIAVSWVNNVSLLGGICSPFLFSFLVTSFGYDLAWALIGLFSLVFAVPVYFARLRNSAEY